MKKILFVMLFVLTGCLKPDLYYSPDVDHHGAGALGQKDLTAWICQETLLNDKTIWVECNFHNRSFKTVDSVCVEVVYYSALTKEEVIRSRKVCSGVLTPNEVSVNYAGFIKKQRELLIAKCGISNNLCVMSVL